MVLQKLLIANRGEIAIRIARAARELGIATVAVYSEDDAASLHLQSSDEAFALSGSGAGAYLDIDGLLAAAQETGCDSVHPGYGFLSESAEFARRCAEARVSFVGPSVEALEIFGDKARAKALAQEQGVPVVPGSDGAVTAGQAREFLESLPQGTPMLIKAIAGGGGRGMRIVTSADEIAQAHKRCQSEARRAFGSDAVYVERLIPRARHVEVQIVGDGSGTVSHIGERECSVQRRHQKLVEIAPSPSITPAVREAITAAAVRLAQAVNFRSLGTFEFLVDESNDRDFFFIETNARLQVEHTVTEEVSGIDLVQAQLRIAAGDTLAGLQLEQASIPSLRGYAIQARVNTETIDPDGNVRPTGGELAIFHLPSGPGIRVDTYGYPGYSTNPNFDSLLAKVIVHSPSSDFGVASKRLSRALEEFRIGGLETNATLLRKVVEHEDFVGGGIYTRWLDENIAELAATQEAFVSPDAATASVGAAIDRRDPLAALNYYREGEGTRSMETDVKNIVGPPGTNALCAPLQGTVTEVLVAEGDSVLRGQRLFVMSALKMEHLVEAAEAGVVRKIMVAVDDIVSEDHPLAFVEPSATDAAIEDSEEEVDIDYVRPSLQALFDRRELLLDENRPAAVERRHSKNRRTVRENIEMLIDPDTWIEYGSLAYAGVSPRLTEEEVIAKTPADGLVAGIGSVNGDLFDENRARTMFISYDDTVLAGTQGGYGHEKTDRMMELANELSVPLIFHCEGAGGRSSDIHGPTGAGHPYVRTWEKMAALSGKVPMIGLTAGWCYAGNAAILGVTDIIIATEDALIAMGGPATIEGTNMGIFLPEEVGPMSDLAPAGSVDIIVKTQDEAIATSKKLVAYFQGSIPAGSHADQRLLRHIVPENHKRAYDVRELIQILADEDSVLELRPEFGRSAVTAFIRIGGHPFGLTVNNNAYIGGAIDSDGSDKVARFWQICDAFNIPIIAMVDTPGMMVGPDIEKTGLIRHCSRLFVTGANLKTPRFSIILRGGYALGALSVMSTGSRAPLFTAAWPDARFGGMNVEAGVLLSNRARLQEIENVEERTAEFERLVADSYDRISAIQTATRFGFDDVIDPAETRDKILKGLASVPNSEPLRRGRGQFINTW